MFKHGMLRYNNEEFEVYIVDEPEIFRLDICTKGTLFHVDPDHVLYSEYRKRKLHVFGNNRYKEMYNKVKSTLRSANLESNYDSEWKDGHFYMYTSCYKDDKFRMDIVERDSIPYKESYIDGDNLLAMKTMKDTAYMTLAPANSPEYKVCESLGLSVKATASSYIPLFELKKRLDLRHLDDNDFGYIHSVEEADAYLDRVYKSYKDGNLIGYDIETDGLDMEYCGKNHLVGLSLSAYDGESRYFPFRHNNSPNLPIEYLTKMYKFLVKVQDLLVAHNKKFDRKGATRVGVDLRVGHDSYLLAVLVNPDVTSPHDLKTLEYLRSHNRYIEFSDIFPDKSNINFADLPEDLIVAYACPDATNCRSVWYKLWEKLPTSERGIYYLEVKLADIKSDQEYYGFRVDMKPLVKSQALCNERIDILKKAIGILSKRSDLNLNSPEVLSDLLYNKMKCKVLLKTDRGKPSTSGKALEKLAAVRVDRQIEGLTEDIRDSDGNLIVKAKDLNSSKYPLIVLLVQYRKEIKTSTAFYNRIVNGSKSFSDNGFTGYRYFSWINQIVSSGRQSSPMHQLPKELKKVILPDAPEFYMVDSDFGQIELRLDFGINGERDLIELAWNPEIDLHRAIQHIISKKPIWAISKEERQKGKKRNFGVVYMIGGKGLALNSFGAGATEEQIVECQREIDEFYTTFKRVHHGIVKNTKFLMKHGYMKTLFNRYKYFPQVFDTNATMSMITRCVRQGNNLVTQGTGADIMKMAEVRIDEYIHKKGWDKLVHTSCGDFPLVRCMLSIHDEPLVSAHRSIPVEEVLYMIKWAMEIKIGNRYKLKKDIKIQRYPRKFKYLGKRLPRTAHEEYECHLAMEQVADNLEPFPPLFSDSSISDNWEEGHGGDYEVPIELRSELIDKYRRTGKSSFNPWATDSDGNYTLKYQIVDEVKKFNKESIVNYMEGLIKEHGDDPSVLEGFVRDDVLTHDLVDYFRPSKAEVKQHGKFTHLELISYATKAYIEQRGRNKEDYVDAKYADLDKDESDIKGDFEKLSGLSDELVEVTDDGSYIYHDGGEDDDLSTEVSLDKSDDEYIQTLSNPKVNYCYRLEDTVVIDATAIESKEAINEILKYIWKDKDDRGFFAVKLAYADKLLDTHIRVESVDINELDKKICEVLGVEQRESE